ncbi:Uncharacterised protein [Chlamydia abortus]|nr:Uncharacterised protein [Chlamydia abortus]
MGLNSKCKTCAKEISKTTKWCPHCGDSQLEPYTQRVMFLLTGAAVLFLLAGLVGGFVTAIIKKF